MQETEQGGLVAVARETFEYNIVPWTGRKYEPWMRGWARLHPIDPGLVQLPAEVYEAFQAREPGQRLSKRQAEALGYPHVPGEQELERVRRELHEALGRCDWDTAHDLDGRLRELQEEVASRRLIALKRRPLLAT